MCGALEARDAFLTLTSGVIDFPQFCLSQHKIDEIAIATLLVAPRLNLVILEPVKRLPTILRLIKDNHLQELDLCLMP